MLGDMEGSSQITTSRNSAGDKIDPESLLLLNNTNKYSFTDDVSNDTNNDESSESHTSMALPLTATNPSVGLDELPAGRPYNNTATLLLSLNVHDTFTSTLIPSTALTGYTTDESDEETMPTSTPTALPEGNPS
mmetsp:Transcript_26687/g.40933  ORF Transcript_26687/g.40933 Transcript_26687/m.40933 type:complete len:134 (+) Transcript_26687:1102-1503(+)